MEPSGICNFQLILGDVVDRVHAETAEELLNVVDQRLGENNVSDQTAVIFPELLGLGQLQDVLHREVISSCSFRGQSSA